MFHIVDSGKSFEDASAALEAAVVEHGFGVLHVHDVGETLREKGVDFAERCRIFEICQPQKAARVMAADMRLNMALPCRVSVWTEDGAVKVGMIEPRGILAALSDDPALGEVAAEVQEAIAAMIAAAR